MKPPTFDQWPEDSLRKFAAILAPLLSRNETVTMDTAYLASLSKEDYAKHIKEGKR